MLLVVRFCKDWSNPKFVDMMQKRSCANHSIKAFKKRDLRNDDEYHYRIYKNIWRSEKHFIKEYEKGNILR